LSRFEKPDVMFVVFLSTSPASSTGCVSAGTRSVVMNRESTAAKRRVRWLTKEEVARLLHALPSHHRQLARFARATEELGAWKTEAMVKRYAHFAPEQLRKAADRLETSSGNGQIAPEAFVKPNRVNPSSCGATAVARCPRLPAALTGL
jgi:hypothetical protein